MPVCKVKPNHIFKTPDIQNKSALGPQNPTVVKRILPLQESSASTGGQISGFDFKYQRMGINFAEHRS